MTMLRAPDWTFAVDLRRRWRQAALRRQMQRYAQLDPRFPADIGLTAEEVGFCGVRADEPPPDSAPLGACPPRVLV
jgi:hypothetical protein